MSIPTDCPQRDERHGWLGDAHLSAEEAVYNFDMAAFYAKFLDDIRLAQKEDGSLPDVVPPYLPRLYPADPAWSSAYATLVWLLWEHYGDRRIVPPLRVPQEIHRLPRPERRPTASSGTLGKYGDWCPARRHRAQEDPRRTHLDLVLLSRRPAPRPDGPASRPQRRRPAVYAKLAESIKTAFNDTFLGESQYAAIRVSPVDTYPNQTVQRPAPLPGHGPPEKKDKVLESLLQSVVRLQDFHVDTGILGTRYILDVLTENGQAEAACRMATHKSYPGWGYMLAEGATTLWERWEKLTGHAMNSQNHIMLGSVDAWFYRVIAGLSPLLPGWKAVRVRPHVLGGMSFAEASIETVAGKVRSAWKKTEDSFSLEVAIPVGATGEVHIPFLWHGAGIFESGKLLWRAGHAVDPIPEVALAGDDAKRAVFKIGSGDYRFELNKGG